MEDQSIATIEKSKIEELRIAVKEYRGRRYVDIRTFCDPYADEGHGRVPTKKGITCPLSKLPELIAALQEAQAQVKKQGLAKREAA